MAYRLTLNRGERGAIDWVGNRYAHGHELYSALWAGCAQTPDDADWDDERDITFTVPEHVAWQIADIGRQDNWTCFAPALVEKLEAFLAKVV